MGYGYWTRNSFVNYSASKGRTVDASGNLDSRLTDQQIFTQTVLHPRLNPQNVIRECCDSEDHPASIPVILALDVTGSMGAASAEVAKKMNEVMTRLYSEIQDVEFMVMGIGDLSYDRAPIQISQFESDIRIAEQLDLVYMEHGGGGNSFESYTAAWYMGLNHTRLDCWKRGKKGLIITMGDETLNPYLPRGPLAKATGDMLQADVETRDLYRQAREKFEIYHMHVKHTALDRYGKDAEKTFGAILPRGHFLRTEVDTIADSLVRVIRDHAGKSRGGLIRWGNDDPALLDEAPPEAAKNAPQSGKKGLFSLISW